MCRADEYGNNDPGVAGKTIGQADWLIVEMDWLLATGPSYPERTTNQATVRPVHAFHYINNLGDVDERKKVRF